MERVDLIDAVKLRKVTFVLNPADEWERFPDDLKDIINLNYSRHRLVIASTQGKH